MRRGKRIPWIFKGVDTGLDMQNFTTGLILLIKNVEFFGKDYYDFVKDEFFNEPLGDRFRPFVEVLRQHFEESSTESKSEQIDRRELYFAFMKEYNALMGESEHQILKEEVEVLLAKYSL